VNGMDGMGGMVLGVVSKAVHTVGHRAPNDRYIVACPTYQQMDGVDGSVVPRTKILLTSNYRQLFCCRLNFQFCAPPRNTQATAIT
jgi:hypothetical protein